MAATRQSSDADRGRHAESPQQIPAGGWWDVLKRSWKEVSDNNIFLAAGGVTYAMLLSLFPALAALVSVYGLIFDPSQIEKQVNALSGLLPQQTLSLVSQELHQLVAASNGTLGVAAIVGLLLTLWSASRGVSGMMSAMNIAYDERERRNFFKFNLIALVLTIGAIIGGVLTIALVGVLPAAVQFIGLGALAKWLILILEWPLLVAILLAGMAVMYRYGPDRDEPQWRWVSPGAITGAVLWIIGSIAFSVYVAKFNTYNKTYGSLGGVVILLTWLYLSSFVVVFGAVINAQSERQTEKDTTEGDPEPMGQRNARAADTVA